MTAYEKRLIEIKNHIWKEQDHGKQENLNQWVMYLLGYIEALEMIRKEDVHN